MLKSWGLSSLLLTKDSTSNSHPLLCIFDCAVPWMPFSKPNRYAANELMKTDLNISLMTFE